jgi:hypothetical protein
MKRIFKIIVLVALFSFALCSSNRDISGTYKIVKGNYRYDSIIIQKVKDDKYSITAMEKDVKKLTSTSTLNGNTIALGWLATLKFKSNFKEFVLDVGNKPVYRKVENK